MIEKENAWVDIVTENIMYVFLRGGGGDYRSHVNRYIFRSETLKYIRC